VIKVQIIYVVRAHKTISMTGRWSSRSLSGWRCMRCSIF